MDEADPGRSAVAAAGLIADGVVGVPELGAFVLLALPGGDNDE